MDLLVHLRGFVGVADELSVSQAAVELGVDQPLLSRRLRALEAELGVQLFDRSRRQIALTADGVALLPRARRLVEQADHLVRSVRAADRSSITLAVPVAADPQRLAELLGLLAEHGVSVQVTAGAGADSAAWCVEPCDPASAKWRTPLGSAAAPGGPDRPGRLSHLRPRRGGPVTPVLLQPQDADDALRAAADRAGLSPSVLREAPWPLSVAEVLAGRAVVLCSEAEARSYGLAWAPVTEPPLARGHRLTERGSLPACLAAGPVRQRALRLVGALLGAAGATGATA